MAANVFVIEAGPGQPVLYQLQPLAQDVPDVVLLSGSVTMKHPPLLDDNFSTNLQIGKVRVLKGKPDTDRATGKLRLRDASLLKPSRLVFLPGPQGGTIPHTQNQCYAMYPDPNDPQSDGDLDLIHCRTAFNNPTSTVLAATPAYLKSDLGSILTWIVEFNPAEGGLWQPKNSDEIYAIEFTIVPKIN